MLGVKIVVCYDGVCWMPLEMPANVAELSQRGFRLACPKAELGGMPANLAELYPRRSSRSESHQVSVTNPRFIKNAYPTL